MLFGALSAIARRFAPLYARLLLACVAPATSTMITRCASSQAQVLSVTPRLLPAKHLPKRPASSSHSPVVAASNKPTKHPCCACSNMLGINHAHNNATQPTATTVSLSVNLTDCSRCGYNFLKAINRKWTQVQRDASKRHLEFSLSEADHKNLLLLPCYYCGTIDKTRGFDRIENNVGYKDGNVVPCCSSMSPCCCYWFFYCVGTTIFVANPCPRCIVCNMMKWVYSRDAFLEQCCRIHVYQKQHHDQQKKNRHVLVKSSRGRGRPKNVLKSTLPRSPPNSPKKKGQKRTFQQCADGAKRRGIDFALTKIQFDRLAKSPCFYCGKCAMGGIDRVDNDIGYVLSNVVPSCSGCNYKKGTFDVDSFLRQCTRIHSTWHKQGSRLPVLPSLMAIPLATENNHPPRPRVFGTATEA